MTMLHGLLAAPLRVDHHYLTSGLQIMTADHGSVVRLEMNLHCMLPWGTTLPVLSRQDFCTVMLPDLSRPMYFQVFYF